MGEYTRTGDGVPNLFGLTQFDGKTQFFDGDTYALPQVSLIHRVDCTSDTRLSKRWNIALGCKQSTKIFGQQTAYFVCTAPAGLCLDARTA